VLRNAGLYAQRSRDPTKVLLFSIYTFPSCLVLYSIVSQKKTFVKFSMIFISRLILQPLDVVDERFLVMIKFKFPLEKIKIRGV